MAAIGASAVYDPDGKFETTNEIRFKSLDKPASFKLEHAILVSCDACT
jgi:hypothetical protein